MTSKSELKRLGTLDPARVTAAYQSLEAKLAIAREALEFYSGKWSKDMLDDFGERAREALEAIK